MTQEERNLQEKRIEKFDKLKRQIESLSSIIYYSSNATHIGIGSSEITVLSVPDCYYEIQEPLIESIHIAIDKLKEMLEAV